MEYVKDDIFKIRYNTNLDRLEIKGEKWTSKIISGIKRHKLITTVIIAFLMFSIVNVIMIYSFINILQNV